MFQFFIEANPVVVAAPTGLTASAVSTTEIDLSWTDNSGGEASFEIDSSANGTSWSQLTTVAAGVTTYSHTGLSAGQTVYYRVRAYVEVDSSPVYSTYTSTVSATTTSSGGSKPLNFRIQVSLGVGL